MEIVILVLVLSIIGLLVLSILPDTQYNRIYLWFVNNRGEVRFVWQVVRVVLFIISIPTIIVIHAVASTLPRGKRTLFIKMASFLDIFSLFDR